MPAKWLRLAVCLLLQREAFLLHEQVGREVRTAITKIGGTMPENLPAVEHIKEAKKRVASAEKKLALDDKVAKGLALPASGSLTFDDI